MSKLIDLDSVQKSRANCSRFTRLNSSVSFQDFGIYFINHYFTIWPGGKPKPDTYFNILGDTFGTILGWYSAYILDKQGSALKWYFPHI